MRKLIPLMIVAMATLGVASSARADEVYTFVVKKQEEKAKSRWSLSEWLDTRDRMRMMDLWLALHSPSPYEFYLSGAYQFAQSSVGPNNNIFNFSAAAYASIFGLEASYESGDLSRWEGLFHFRFFGMHYQATHLRLEGGIRSENDGVASYRSPLAGAALAVYFGKYFGVDALYRHAFSSTPNGAGLRLSSNRYEGGAFIDFQFLRVFGKYTYEDTEGATRSGPMMGLKFFF